ncbi:MAG: DUF4040 family protein [Propionibacteriaceae bacterium]|nr:DUF4040 family protein [Propionibacteriaceae bacterium]
MNLILTLTILAASVVATPLLTRLLGRNAGWPLAGAYLAASVTLWPAAAEALTGNPPVWSLPWVPALGIEFSLRADGLGIIFAYIALLIGAVVFSYSTRYLDKGRQLGFYLVMTMFTTSMLGLVLAGDLVVLFIAWELTSLASFLLIASAGQSGEAPSMRTLLLTFIGGIFLLIAVALTWQATGTTVLSEVFAHPVWASDPEFTAGIAVLVALAAFTKSAQFPFHVWLPDAMAAITPVSAYLHAAAVVKAGIFLLLRFSPVFSATPAWNALLLAAGLFTTCIGAWFALQQTDLKKLMAYSTVSQLGLIVATIGIGTGAALTAAVIHTIAHSLFKSGLFMLVGVIDHSTNTKDLRRLPPKLYRQLPVTFAFTALGCASMAGIPPMMGFISKEAIFASLLDAPGASWTGWAALLVAALGSVLTFSYCVKIVIGAFIDGTEEGRAVERPGWVLLGSAALPIAVSVVFALVIGVLDAPVGAAATASLGAAVDAHLTLWHGLTVELGASALVIGLGCLVAWRRRPVFRTIENNPFPYTGADVIHQINRGLRRVGTYLNELVNDYSPFRHVLAILGCLGVIGLGGVFVLIGVGLPGQTAGLDQPIDLVILLLISVAVISVVRSRARIAATVSLSAVGILATVQILSLGAPDVALTQLLVESLSIIVIMLVLQRLPLEFPKPSRRHRGVSVLVSLLVGASVAGLTWALNGRRDKSQIAQYYLENTEPIAGGFNVVNVILVEFRALDTMGELAVLGMAGVAIIALLSSVRHRHLDPEGVEERQVPEPVLALREDPHSTAFRAIHVPWPNAVGLQLMLRVVNPVLIVISAVLFFRGHNEPGGGFIAALVASAAIGLTYLSTSKDRQLGPPRLPLGLIGGGVLTAVSTGLAGLALVGSFLEPIHGHLAGIHLTTSMIFDVGVYCAVVGLILVAFNVLGVSKDTLERTRERVDEAVEGEVEGPLDTVRGEKRVAIRSEFIANGTAPREVGR